MLKQFKKRNNLLFFLLLCIGLWMGIQFRERGISFLLLVITTVLFVLKGDSLGKSRYRAVVWVQDHLFLLCSLMMGGFFLFSRLPLFYHPVPLFTMDSLTYYFPLWQIEQGQYPKLAVRAPGYPLFLYLLLSVYQDWFFVMAVQNLITLFSALVMVYAVYSTYRPSTVPVMILLTGFITSSMSLFFDTSILSEGLYTSFLLLSSAFLILSIHSSKNLFWGMTSFFMGMVIFIRPSGIFMVVIFFMVGAYLFFKRSSKKKLLSFSLPFWLILISFCSYNYLTIGKFTFSILGEMSIIRHTTLLWETDPHFPPAVNQAIQRVKRLKNQEGDWPVLKTSWKASEVFPIYGKTYDFFIKSNLYRCGSSYDELRPLYKKIIWKALRENPGVYLRLTLFMMKRYFYDNLEKSKTCDYYFWQGRRCEFFLTEELFLSLRSYQTTVTKYDSGYRLFTIPAYGSKKKAIETGHYTRSPPYLLKLHRIYLSIHKQIFHTLFWNGCFFFAFFFSLFCLIKDGLSSPLGFFLFILTSSTLGAGIIYCLMGPSLERYSFPLSFVYYLSLPLSIQLLLERIKVKKNEKG